MKQFQFEVNNRSQLHREMLRVKRFYQHEASQAIVFQIFAQEVTSSCFGDVINTIEKEFPEAIYYGCQSSGNIKDGYLLESNVLVVCSIYEYEGTKTELVCIDLKDPSATFSSVEELWKYCNRNTWVKSVELLSSYYGAEQLELGGPIDNLRPEVHVFGGIAIDYQDMTVNETMVFGKMFGKSTTSVMAFLLGGDDIHVGSSFISGWEGLGKSFTVTKSEGNVIQEIDNAPAINVYKQYLDISEDDRFVSDVTMFPLLVEHDGIECIRVPMRCENNQDMRMLEHLEEGTKIRFAYGDRATIMHHVRDKVREFAAFAPDVVQIYSCVIRTMFWRKKEVSKETELFGFVAPTVGFYTKGEFLRVNNYLHYFNSTIVCTMIREGEAYPADVDIEDVLNREEMHSALASHLINYVGAVTEEIEGQFNRTMMGIARVYDNMFLIDMDEQEFTVLGENELAKQTLAGENSVKDKMDLFLERVVKEEELEKAKEFCDIDNMVVRLKDRDVIACELIGKYVGWFRIQCVVINRNEEGIPTQFVFTTQIIEEEKRREERLIKRSLTDELTGLLNRRAFEEDLKELESDDKGLSYILVSLDVNGLKVVNDSLGHAAGDEMLVGAAICIKRCLGAYGKAYRVGGDEFAAIMYVDEETLERAKEDFMNTVSEWRGKQDEHLSVSGGYVLSSEFPEYTMNERLKLADQRMYEKKELYYANKGVERQIQKRAYDMICNSYIKILRVNLTQDSYEIIKTIEDELTVDKGYEDKKISKWLQSFVAKGQVHKSDRETFMQRTDMYYLRRFFAEPDKSFVLHYRRKIGDEFKEVMMEMVPVDNPGSEDIEVFLYVKNIAK